MRGRADNERHGEDAMGGVEVALIMATIRLINGGVLD